MEKILIIANWFPPTNTIGAKRPYRLALYLKERGYDVEVLCSDGGYHKSNLDFNLEKIKVTYLKTPAIIKFLNNPGGSFIFKLLKRVLKLFLYPDEYSKMFLTYTEQAEKLITLNNINVVFTSAWPISMHSVGSLLKRRNSTIKWIADYRDVWSYSPYRKVLPFQRFFDFKYEYNLIKNADLITFVTDSSRVSYSSKIPSLASKMLTVRNGIGLDDYFPLGDLCGEFNNVDNNCYEIIYCGALYKSIRNPEPLLKALLITKKCFTLHFVGSEFFYVEKYRNLYPTINIKYTPHVSFAKSLQLQSKADILLVILGSLEFEDTLLPGKFFEYLASGKQILAVSNPESEIGVLINSHNLGFASKNHQEIKQYLDNFIPDKVVEVSYELTSDSQFDKLLETKVFNCKIK